jgi:UDP-N-acetylglucosamine acyltransferase
METIYENTENQIDYGAQVHPSVRMGKGNVIRAGAVICEGVEIGHNNYIGPGCIIGDYPEKIGYFDKFGKVSIGNGNRFTKQVTIDSGTEGITVVENDTILLKNAHLGHDSYIESKVVLSCNVCIGGHTRVGENTNFGLGAVAHQRLIIPEGIMVGMNSTITKKTVLKPNRKLVGSPARDIGPNIREQKGSAGDPNAYC